MAVDPADPHLIYDIWKAAVSPIKNVGGPSSRHITFKFVG